MSSLTILLLHNPPDEVRGKVRKYLYEIEPNVFCGKPTASVRDTLWQELSAADVSASLIKEERSEQGFVFEHIGEARKYSFQDFNGVMLTAREKAHLKLSDVYAKPDMPLMEHLNDVGCIAEALMKKGRAKIAIEHIAQDYNVPVDELVSSVALFCSLHDLGKCHPVFQKKLYESDAGRINDALGKAQAKINALHLNMPTFDSFRHERYSRQILLSYIKEKNMQNPRFFKKMLSIIAYHHQGKSDAEVGTTSYDAPKTAWKDLQYEAIDFFWRKWPYFESVSVINEIANGFTYFALSILVVADWVASGEKWLSMKRMNANAGTEELAEAFIFKNALACTSIREAIGQPKWKDVFDFAPNTLQQTVIECAKKRPQLMIIEAPCGMGKSEAALAAAMAYADNASGIYFASPTMATAAAMRSRMQEIATKVGLPYQIPELDSSAIWSDDEMSRIDSTLWVSKSRHSMLYPFSVGTVDQVLKSVVKHRYGCIGMLGISDKVIIIDEVHAYDEYMLEEIKMLIQYCHMMRTPVILLSATLPTKAKAELLSAAGCNQLNLEKAYPLVTTCTEGVLTETTFDVKGKVLPIQVVEADNSLKFMEEKATKVYDGCLCLVQGTVDKAITLYKRLSGELSNAVLYHSRDTVERKTKTASALILELGKNRVARPKQRIVVATSIIEQSLDVDFDYMMTTLAPVDLLIQRFGRVWRHEDAGTIRESRKIENPIYIVAEKDFGQLSGIYDKGLLSKTLDVLKQYREIDTITDVRTLVDSVYDAVVRERAAIKHEKGQIVTIDQPFDSLVQTLAMSSSQYIQFNRVSSQTRDISIPTRQVGIINCDASSLSFEEARQLMREKVVSVPEAKLTPFKNMAKADVGGLLEGVLLFQGNESRIESHGKGMALTPCGMEFYDVT